MVTRGGWRCVSIVPGGQCVEMGLIQTKLKSCVDHLVDLQPMVHRVLVRHCDTIV